MVETTDRPQQNHFAEMLASLEERARRDREAGVATDSNVFLQAFISFFLRMLGIEQEEPEFIDAETPEDADRARSEYEGGRRQTEERESQRYNTPDNQFTPQRITASMETLSTLRAEYGEGVRAIMPLRNGGDVQVNSPYGMRHHPIHRENRMHQGVDIVPVGGGSADIIAPMPGVVIFAGRRGGYGNVVEVMDIYGVTHRFAHLRDIDVRVGATVRPGEQLGEMGATGAVTGPHLHYEQIDAQGRRRDPEIMGRTWSRGQHLSGAEASAAAASHDHDEDRSAPRATSAGDSGRDAPARVAPGQPRNADSAGRPVAARSPAPRNQDTNEDLPAAAARIARETGDNIVRAANDARENAGRAMANVSNAIGGFFRG